MTAELTAQMAALQHELEQVREREALLIRREELLTQIASATRAATNSEEITDRATTLLGRYMGVNRCAYAEVGEDPDSITVVGNFVDELPSMVGSYSLHQFSDTAYEQLTAGEPFIVEDVETAPQCSASLEAFRASGVRATISHPLMRAGRLIAILAVHTRHPRQWSRQEQELVATVASRCWESLERARIMRALEADRERLRAKSVESERRLAELETIYDTAPIGLAYFDLDDYHYRRLNHRQAAFFGLKPEQILGKTLTEMSSIPVLRELFDQVARGEPVINYPLEGTVATDPSEHRYWTVSYFPVFGPDGLIEGITAASQEITQQKKVEKAMVQTEKLAAVGRLAASIAHEINNPLESVTNLLYLAQRSDQLSEVRNLLQTADAELRRVSAITAQTLRFHRQSSKPLAIDTEALIGETINVYHGRLHNSRAHLSMRLRARRTLLCFDGEIRQVLANLIGNALDALNSSEGCLLLRTREGTHWSSGRKGIVFTIADTGTGIAPGTKEKIFEPFFTTKGTVGTGLGLWVSKEIVSRHQGALKLRTSQSAEHHGTVFTMFLPFEAVSR